MNLQQEISKMKERLNNAHAVCLNGIGYCCSECPLDFMDERRLCVREWIERWIELAERFQRLKEYCSSNHCSECPLDDSKCYQIGSLINNKPPYAFYYLSDKDLIKGIELIIKEEV